jgi:FixJ family two-component response regulator
MRPEPALVAIVDDDARICTALLRLFRFASYRAEAFRSAEVFLETLAAQPPSCVVLDLHLPGMPGIELLRQLRALERAPPVVVITADDDERLERQCASLGTRQYFRKPVDGDALLEAVRTIVGAP